MRFLRSSIRVCWAWSSLELSEKSLVLLRDGVHHPRGPRALSSSTPRQFNRLRPLLCFGYGVHQQRGPHALHS